MGQRIKQVPELINAFVYRQRLLEQILGLALNLREHQFEVADLIEQALNVRDAGALPSICPTRYQASGTSSPASATAVASVDVVEFRRP